MIRIASKLHNLKLCLLCALAGLSVTGCFDADAMIAERRKVAILARLEEVDLGEFRLTLPRPVQTNDMAEIQFQVFGQVANRDLEEVTEALEMYGPELRHRILLAARQLQLEDMEDAELALLRSEITTVVNETIPGEPVHSIGVKELSYYNF